MKRIHKKKIYMKKILYSMAAGICCLGICACGSRPADSAANSEEGNPVSGTEEQQEAAKEQKGLAFETAKDGHIDFEALREENPDIFAWLYIPGTDIDEPVLQSGVADDYYESHTSDGGEGEDGALYTEMANLMNMCDFNTIIHGKDEEGQIFYELHEYENPDFFEKNKNFYIYLPDNVLTYEIVAAYYDEGSDILRRHDYTTMQGCQDYLDGLYGARDMGKNMRTGWEELTPYHFLVTLNGNTRENGSAQYVVVGAMTGDAAGLIDRVILD